MNLVWHEHFFFHSNINELITNQFVINDDHQNLKMRIIEIL